ncbi:MAG TPA: hypothetical protein DIT07_14280 [Sphingobacteriaceae bacterium]|nr:hypothetical protein [Sphingobacteriaceae bacterium]
MKIIYSKLAVFDLKSIYDFIRKDLFPYAVKEVKSIRTVINALKSQPNIGKFFEIQNKETIRELVYKHYRIIYEITSDKIEILSIHHSARLLENDSLFNDLDAE